MKATHSFNLLSKGDANTFPVRTCALGHQPKSSVMASGYRDFASEDKKGKYRISRMIPLLSNC
jgi:hypothetical protein